MSPKKRLWVPLVSVVLALGLVATTSGSAAAKDGWQPTSNVPYGPDFNHVKCGRDGGPALEARGCFQPRGEWFWLIDLKRNGNPVVIRWRFYAANDVTVRRAGDIYNNLGKAATWTNKNKSFVENRRLRFRVCEANIPDKRVYDCGRWREIRT